MLGKFALRPCDYWEKVFLHVLARVALYCKQCCVKWTLHYVRLIDIKTLWRPFLLFTWRKRQTLHKNCSYFKVNSYSYTEPALLWTAAIEIHANSCLQSTVHGYLDSDLYQCEPDWDTVQYKEFYLKRDIRFPHVIVVSSLTNDSTDVSVHVSGWTEYCRLRPTFSRYGTVTTASSIAAGFGNERRAEYRRCGMSSQRYLFISMTVDRQRTGADWQWRHRDSTATVRWRVTHDSLQDAATLLQFQIAVMFLKIGWPSYLRRW